MKKFVAKKNDVPLQTLVPLEVEGKKILLYRTSERTYAMENSCPHQSKELDTGCVRGQKLSCRYHGVGIDIDSGAIAYDSGYLDLPDVTTYAVTVDDEDIFIEID